jgi:hypothetical protein
MEEIMKKLVLALGLSVILGVAVNAQQQHKSMQMKDTTHMKSKKPVQKRSGESYQMKKGTAKQDKTMKKGSMQQMEDTSKIKSKGKPVYKR